MLLGHSSAWFAIQVRTGFEFKISSVLKTKGYEEFVPTYQLKKGEWGFADKPLFPGYVFCLFDPTVSAPIVTTPGVIRIVGYGSTPIFLSDSEMQAIRTVVNSTLPAKPHSYQSPGQRVRIRQGPLRGVEGSIADTGDRRRLIVSLSLLQRSIAVEVQPEWLEPMLIRCSDN